MPRPDAHHKLAVLRRRQSVADLYVQGVSQMAIAERLGISQATVSADLKQIRREWRESAIRDFDHAQDRELQKIDRLERESWEAWERSQKPVQSAVIEGEGAQQPRRKTMRSQNGDPRYLEIVHKCIAARCLLLGLNAPQRLEHSGPIVIRVVEEEGWYGNDAHERDRARFAITETVDAPEADPVEPGSLQAGRVWPALGQNGSGLNGTH